MAENQKRMSLEEKKKLERIMVEEVQEAESELRQAREVGESQLERTLEDTPSKQVKEAYARYLKATEEVSSLKESLGALGYTIGYGDVRLEVSSEHPDLVAFKAESRQLMKRLQKLQRDHLVKVYAESGTMQSLLESFTKELRNVFA